MGGEGGDVGTQVCSVGGMLALEEMREGRAMLSGLPVILRASSTLGRSGMKRAGLSGLRHIIIRARIRGAVLRGGKSALSPSPAIPLGA
eukprot:GAFH01002098.1.p5 GENE.GAFH01002098.1~~GAFH01002098.1.p5  ORF type:complete len:89 (-),score=3.01 GAFH01002098.1:192-458(-)